MTESLSDVVESIADMVGKWGGGPEHGDHEKDCECRICFTSSLNIRICEAVSNDVKLGLVGVAASR